MIFSTLNFCLSSLAMNPCFAHRIKTKQYIVLDKLGDHLLSVSV